MATSIIKVETGFLAWQKFRKSQIFAKIQNFEIQNLKIRDFQENPNFSRDSEILVNLGFSEILHKIRDFRGNHNFFVKFRLFCLDHEI